MYKVPFFKNQLNFIFIQILVLKLLILYLTKGIFTLHNKWTYIITYKLYYISMTNYWNGHLGFGYKILYFKWNIKYIGLNCCVFLSTYIFSNMST